MNAMDELEPEVTSQEYRTNTEVTFKRHEVEEKYANLFERLGSFNYPDQRSLEKLI
jgi:hypothetical protein